MDNTTINCVDFVEAYKKAPTLAAKEKLCKGTIVSKYVPVMEKYAALYAVYNESNRNAAGNIRYNSFSGYVAYTMMLINLYTNIKYDSVIDAYDALTESGALSNIIKCIDNNELSELSRIYEFIDQDTKDNEVNPYSYFSIQISKMIDVLKIAGSSSEFKELVEAVKNLSANNHE